MMLAQSLTIFRRGVCSFSLQVRACIGTAKYEANWVSYAQTWPFRCT
jgi:hypothetical protein